MKKFFTVIAIAITFIGSATKADAQCYTVRTVITASHDLAYDNCRDNVLRGDNEFRRGAYSSAQLYYRRALTDNIDCIGHKYISDAELNRKLDDCQFALTHNGMTRHEYDAQQRLNAQTALATAIVNASVNRQNNSNADVARQMLAGSNNTAELNHFNNNGVSYDANNKYAQITKVEKKANATIVHFEYLNISKDISLGIHADTYITDKATGKKLILSDSEGIYTNDRLHVVAGDTHDFTLTFPAVSKDCHSIDIVDPDNGGWKFYHVAI